MKKYVFITPLASLVTITPIVTIVACDNKQDGGDSSLGAVYVSNSSKSYQGKVFTLPTNLTLGMDLLVEDGKGHMNDTS